MTGDEEIWKYLLSEKRYFSYGDIKRKFPGLHPQKISRTLRRLEKEGLLIRDVFVRGSKPANNYMAIDPDDPGLSIEIHDLQGWMYATITWTNNDGSSTSIIGIELGEIANYIEPVGWELILRWPMWIENLEKAGKVKFKENN